MENIEIYNIACRHGVSNNSIVSKAVQLTDESVLKSIYKWGFDPCWEIENCVDTKKRGVIKNSLKRRVKKGGPFLLLYAI